MELCTIPDFYTLLYTGSPSDCSILIVMTRVWCLQPSRKDMCYLELNSALTGRAAAWLSFCAAFNDATCIWRPSLTPGLALVGCFHCRCDYRIDVVPPLYVKDKRHCALPVSRVKYLHTYDLLEQNELGAERTRWTRGTGSSHHTAHTCTSFVPRFLWTGYV